MIFSLELEKQLLAGLIKYPHKYSDISTLTTSDDFYSEESVVHKTIFNTLTQAIENSEAVNEATISHRVLSLGISFEDNISVGDYINSLGLIKISENFILNVAKELKKLSIRRELSACGENISKAMHKLDSSESFDDIIAKADKLYNGQVNLYDVGDRKPENIFDEMKEWVEFRGKNPITEFGMMGPHKRVNELYGSLLRPGNITVICARAGVGKTQFCMDFSTKISAEYGVPVLHFDNGEMSKEELIVRQCAALSKIPVHLLETGLWRQAGDDIVNRVRSVWEKIKNMKFFYYNVAGMSSGDMISLLKRFYFSEVGRGKEMIFSFDYIKTTSETNDKNRSEWELVGSMVQRFKDCIHRDIKFDGEPMVSMITSVQSNRQGIVNNRRAENVVDDESIFSLSDRIVQFASHAFILRKKTEDEMEEEPNFGSHKLKCVKYRHLGQDVNGALNPIRMQNGSLQQNYVHLDFNNFHISEKGDLRDLVRYLDQNPEIIEDGN
tara:strand:- start:411 stop:1901 length:1491 start_codon:yes stop_codon:yes gene_type:complete